MTIISSLKKFINFIESKMNTTSLSKVDHILTSIKKMTKKDWKKVVKIMSNYFNLKQIFIEEEYHFYDCDYNDNDYSCYNNDLEHNNRCDMVHAKRKVDNFLLKYKPLFEQYLVCDYILSIFENKSSIGKQNDELFFEENLLDFLNYICFTRRNLDEPGSDLENFVTQHINILYNQRQTITVN